MKKILYTMLIGIFVFFPVRVLAAGYVSISPGSLTIEQGSSKTFKITAYNAIGDVTIKSNNTSIATVNKGEWSTGAVDEKETKTTSITVTGKTIGSTIITLTIDAATFDSEDLSGQVKTIAVNVVAKSKPAVNPSPTPPATNPTPSTSQSTTNSNKNTYQQNNLSTNNKIGSLIVEGYEVVKVDDNNYTLNVMKDIEKIKISATPQDTKATINGIGEKSLIIGENKFQIVVIAENGSANIINLIVTRKDGNYLEDLEVLLNKNDLKNIDIIINADSKLTKEQLELIKKSKKIVNLNYYDESKKLIYSWSLNGDKIENTDELVTIITFPTKDENIYKASNYADGIYLKFAHNKELPIGTKLKLFVGNKFDSESSVNVYYYDNSNNTLVIIKKDLKVINGYIEFEPENTIDSFVTMSIMKNAEKEIKNTEESSNNIVIIIETIVIIGLLIFIVYKFCPIKIKRNDKNNLESNLMMESLNQQLNSEVTQNEEILDINITNNVANYQEQQINNNDINSNDTNMN